MPRCEGAMPSAMQPVGKRFRSQLRLVHGRERQPAMTTSASAPSTSPQKSPIGCTSSLYHFAHFFHFARSESTKREPTAESSEANIAAPRRPEGRQHPCGSVGWSVRVPAFGAHAVLRQIGKSRSERKQGSTTTVYRQHPVIPILVNRSCPTCPLVSNTGKGTPCTPPQYAFVKDSCPDRPCTDTDGDWERVFV